MVRNLRDNLTANVNYYRKTSGNGLKSYGKNENGQQNALKKIGRAKNVQKTKGENGKGQKNVQNTKIEKRSGEKTCKTHRTRIWKGQAHTFMAAAHFYGLARIFAAGRAFVWPGRAFVVAKSDF